MNLLSRLFRIFYIVIGLIVALSIIGCEPYQAIIYDNRTSTPVNVHLDLVPLDYTGNPTRTWNDPGDIIEAGESKELITWVPNTKGGGNMYKYTVVAVTEKEKIILSKVFTWDELHDMGWRVVIEAQE